MITLSNVATLERTLAEFTAATDKIARERKQMNLDDDDEFAKQLKAAVEKQLGSRARLHKNAPVSSSNSDESFAERLTRITKAKAQLRKP